MLGADEGSRTIAFRAPLDRDSPQPARPAFARLAEPRAVRDRAGWTAWASSNRRIIRWYCVLCLRASVLKKSTLRLLNAIVTFTPSSRKTKSSGRGTKSGTSIGGRLVLPTTTLRRPGKRLVEVVILTIMQSNGAEVVGGQRR